MPSLRASMLKIGGSLSIKDLEPNAWDRFVNDHHPGDVVKGKIARFANFGAFVELDDNLEGLCHISNSQKSGSRNLKMWFNWARRWNSRS